MGTRNLTIVVSNGQIKVAQYGQWDGYPTGQGATILEFLRETMNKNFFVNQLKKVRFLEEEEHKQLFRDLGIDIDDNGGCLTSEESYKYREAYPQLSRDMGGEILEYIQDCEDEEILLQDYIEFVGDSLFCEWAYVVDLDNDKLEVYHGFNKEPLTEEDRFYKYETDFEHRKEKYYPVKLVKTFSFKELPLDAEEFEKKIYSEIPEYAEELEE